MALLVNEVIVRRALELVWCPATCRNRLDSLKAWVVFWYWFLIAYLVEREEYPSLFWLWVWRRRGGFCSGFLLGDVQVVTSQLRELEFPWHWKPSPWKIENPFWNRSTRIETEEVHGNIKILLGNKEQWRLMEFLNSLYSDVYLLTFSKANILQATPYIRVKNVPSRCIEI